MNLEFRFANKQEEVDEAYNLAAKVFGPDYFTARDSKIVTKELEPVEELSDIVIAVQNNEIVGFIRVINRDIWLGSNTLKVGGITSVCLHPKLRGQGCARELMEHAIKRLSERRDCLSITFARRKVDGFYSKFGYIGLGCHVELSLSDITSFSKKICHPVLKYGVDNRFLDTYALAYEASYKSLFMSFHRNSKWWKNFPIRFSTRIDAQGFINVMEGDKLVGYFIIYLGRVIEIASVPGCQQIVMMGLSMIFGEKKDIHTLSLPLSHWAMQAMFPINHTLKIRYSWDGGHMVRVLNEKVFHSVITQYLKNQNSQINNLFNIQSPQNKDCNNDVRVPLFDLAKIACISLGLARPTWSLMDEY